MNRLKVLIADDERPAREFLRDLLKEMGDVEVAGIAENGSDALEQIKSLIVAFVTAFDDQAVSAFELNAVDYLLKPVEKKRLRETILRASERLEREDWQAVETEKIQNATVEYDVASRSQILERIPVKVREEIVLVPVDEISSINVDGELLQIRTAENQKYVINYRLKDIEQKLDPKRFVRLSRSAVINLDEVMRIAPLPGGTYVINMKNGQELTSSRMQSKVLRATLLKI